jgi:hypothetical protein
VGKIWEKKGWAKDREMKVSTKDKEQYICLLWA